MNESFKVTYVGTTSKVPFLLHVLNSPCLYFAVSILGNLVPGKLGWFFITLKVSSSIYSPAQYVRSVLEPDTRYTFVAMLWGNSKTFRLKLSNKPWKSEPANFFVVFKFSYFIRQWGPWLDDTVGPGCLLRSTHLQGFCLCLSTPTWPWPKMASLLGTTWHTRKSARVSLKCPCLLL